MNATLRDYAPPLGRDIHGRTAFRSPTLGDAAAQPANNLNALRLGFALLVILSHSYPLSRGIGTVEPLGAWSRGATNVGQLAVAFFFIVSGFLISGSWDRSRSIGDYLKKRASRILPGYAVACLFTLLLFLPFSTPLGPYVKYVGISLATMGQPNFSGTLASNPFPYYVNGSLWTIRYECYCYLGLAVLGMIGIMRRKLLSVCICALWVVFYLMNDRLHVLANRTLFAIGNVNTWLAIGMYFLSGMAFYAARNVVTLSLPWFAVCAAASLFACRYGGNAIAHAAIALLGAYMVLYLGFLRQLPLHKLGRHNDYSYGTYLYAFAVQQGLVAVIPSARSPLMLFIFASLITAPIAWASWHYVERPFLSAKRRNNLERSVG